MFPRLAATVAFLAALHADPVGAGWPRQSSPAVVVAAPTAYRPIVATGPRLVPTPNGLTQVPTLGTFYPTPSMIVVTGSPGTTYTPAGLYSDVGAIAVYGPTSRFRTRAAETIVYSRGYNGALVPTASATVFTNPGLDPRANRPETFRLSDFGTPRPRSTPLRGRTPFLLGEY